MKFLAENVLSYSKTHTFVLCCNYDRLLKETLFSLLCFIFLSIQLPALPDDLSYCMKDVGKKMQLAMMSCSLRHFQSRLLVPLA